ncbi:MAG: hypothetical protein HPY68_10790 [Candidatus Atribacteria bacterium]|nr:hypothetical protein [Candidatus Atribacteria bacterium]
MKWFLVLGIVACLLFAGVVWAEEDEDPVAPNISEIIPEGLTDAEKAIVENALNQVGPEYSTNHMAPSIPSAQCIEENGAWAEVTGGGAWSCNQDPCVSIYVKASVAQWFKLCLSGTTIQWYVLKPGVYELPRGMKIFGVLLSNGDVTLSFNGFENLRKKNDSGYTNDKIATRYKYEELFYNSGWLMPSQLNQFTRPVNMWFAPLVHCFWLANKIETSWFTPACEYEDPNGATICVTLDEQKGWLES